MYKTILHFSDIHFGGRQAPYRAEALLAEIERRSPSLVAISGDLTQRARTAEFQQARAFLDRITAPFVVVPGNHDVPLWNVFDRFMSPLEKYRRWITNDLTPTFVDEDLVVMGIDTTRSFTIKGGHVEASDLREVKARLCELPGHIFKVLVAHHPFASPPGFEIKATVTGVHHALLLFDQCGVDAVLTGHLHQTYVANSKNIYPHLQRNILLVQAGTAASLRGRGSELMKNSFNFMEVTKDEIKVTAYVYDDSHETFAAGARYVAPRHY